MQQISLQEKLEENSNYLNDYAVSFAKSKKIKYSKVSSLIVNDFVESDTFVRNHLDKKFKNQNKTSIKSKLTKLKNKITKQEKELELSKMIYESMVNQKK